MGFLKCVCNSCAVQEQACVARANSRESQKHPHPHPIRVPWQPRGTWLCTLSSPIVFSGKMRPVNQRLSLYVRTCLGDLSRQGLMELSHYRFYSTLSLNSFLCIVSSFLHKTEIRRSLDIRISRKSNQIQITPKKERAIKMTKQNERGERAPSGRPLLMN